MSAITTHVLDLSTGQPADGVSVLLEREVEQGKWDRIGEGKTDSDGRLRNLVAENLALNVGNYRITFDIDGYYAGWGMKGFYPQAAVTFFVDDASKSYHVPLLLSPYGYSTYRGS